MALPPPYTPGPGGQNWPRRVNELSDLPPWIGHMDARTATSRAFEDGMKDGHSLNIGEHRPRAYGQWLEPFYLRGVAYTAVDHKPDGGALAGVRLYDVSRGPYDDFIMGLSPEPWLPPAILPLPFERAAQTPRHQNPLNGVMRVTSFPQIPLPEDVDRSSLTSEWDDEDRDALFNLHGYGCWAMPEGQDIFPASYEQVEAAARSAAAVIAPGHGEVRIHHGPSLRARATGAVFIEGSEPQIRALVEAKYVMTPPMGLIIFPNRPRRSTFTCTFGGGTQRLEDYDETLWSVRDAIEGDESCRKFCETNEVSIAETISSIELEFVNLHGRTLWNVSMEPPSCAPNRIRRWRRLVEDLSPRNGDGTYMTAIMMRCRVCRCRRHTSCLCPTKAYEEWTGAIEC